MKISLVQNIASAGSKMLSAITAQIGEFVEAGKLKSQSTLPTTAFLLGCLAIAMSLVESHRPREWWENLPYDLKLLLLALIGVLLILLSELGHQMRPLLRQFYSGEWPSWFWSIFGKRKSYLEQQVSYQKEKKKLDHARSQLENADTAIPRTTSQTKKTKLPVLRVPVHAYQLITPDIVELAEPKEDKLDGVIDNLGDLIGRYPLRALDANNPIKQADLKSVPREDLFKDRKVVRIPVDEPALIKHLNAGSVVSMIVRKSNSQNSYDEIMILDRPDDGTIVVSMKEQDVPSVLNDLDVPHTYNATLNFASSLSLDVQRVPGGREKLEFILTPITEKDYLTGVPVAKIALQPGQIIKENDHVQWSMMKSQTVIKHETKLENIIDKIYWPKIKNDGSEKNNSLNAGDPLEKEHLHPIPDKNWLTYIDENGKPQDRIIDQIWVESKYPIRGGDRLRVSDQNGTLLDRFCYVVQIAEENTANNITRYRCFLAVSKPLDSKRNYKATPFDEIPVLIKNISRGTLIRADNIRMKEFRVGDSKLFKDAYVEIKHLVSDPADEKPVHTYVAMEMETKELQAGKPILRTQVLQATKHEKKLTFQADKCTFPIDYEKDENKSDQLKPGDLVSVNLNDQVYWDEAFVCTAEIQGNTLSKCELTIPEDIYSKAKSIIDEAKTKVSCKITITHNDAYFISKMKKYKELISQKASLTDINQAINDQDVEWISKKTKEVCELIDEMQSFFEKFKQRPWQSEPQQSVSDNKEYYKDLMDRFFQHADTVDMWEDAIEKLIDSRIRGKKLTLPDSLPETRATALGNVLAAAAYYPTNAYNIDTATLLPRLILSLGDDHKAVQRLNAANDTLSMLLLFSFWSALWTLFGVLSYTGAWFYGVYGTWWFWLIIVWVGPMLSWLFKEAALAQAYNYGEALKVLFDTERFVLFKATGIVIEEKDKISGEQEHKYWKEFFQLYALGDTDNFPPIKLPELDKGAESPKEAEKK